METIKCKKCGCEMSAMSEACPLCGTSTQEVEVTVSAETVKKSKSPKGKKTKTEQTAVIKEEEVSQPIAGGYTRLPDVEVSESLLNVLEEYVKNVRVNPRYYCLPLADDVDIAGHIHGDDFTLISDVMFTNRPNFFIEITLKNEEEKAKFKALENSRLYRLEHGDSYSLECGGDAEKCAYLFSEIVQKVWGISDKIEYTDEGCSHNYEDVCLYLNDNNEAWNTLSQMTKAYNTEAKANDYPQFELIASERLLKGSLSSYLDKGSFLSKKHKTYKKMKKEFEAIIEFAIKNLEE